MKSFIKSQVFFNIFSIINFLGSAQYFFQINFLFLNPPTHLCGEGKEKLHLPQRRQVNFISFFNIIIKIIFQPQNKQDYFLNLGIFVHFDS